MAHYQIWDTEGANLCGEFETEDDALRYVRECVDLNGRGSVDSLVLGHTTGEPSLLKGSHLADQALKRFPQKQSA